MGARQHTDEQIARAIELYMEHGPADAARRLAAEGVPVKADTLRKWASRAGASEPRSDRVEAATAASVLSLRHRQTALAEGLMSDVEKLRERLFAPAISTHWGVRSRRLKNGTVISEPVFRQHDVPAPTFADQRNLMQAVGVGVDRVQLLTGEATGRIDIGAMSVEEARANVVNLAEVLRRRAEAQADGLGLVSEEQGA
jgi:hypothetical protein